ncbi:YceI family protein [Roseovarius sp.]|uniref:YceI family protein n=1 Tax=Roseovarius sp. TaxID=1486281 RepID=UPI00262FFBB8|nr:YceI family protein [Roseovarius sp.]
MKKTLIAAALAVTATGALAAPQEYSLDPGHSQVVFSYNHLGFSTTHGMFSGFEGEIVFDAEDPASSSVTVSMPLMSMMTGWEKRFEHFMSEDFFGAAEGDMITFTSTGIEVTGDNTAKITGDLSMNGVTKSVTLDTTLNQALEAHPMSGTPWIGLDATTTLLRSDFGVDKFAPYVSDEIDVKISIEAGQDE